MAKQKKGKIIVVAKTGGIKFEDEPEKWYNPTNTAKPYVTQTLKGKNVEITLADDENTFSYINVSSDETEEKDATKTVSKDDYWNDKAERDKINGERISRHGALNTAIELLKLHQQAGGKMDLNETPILERVTSLAEILLKWINKEKGN